MARARNIKPGFFKNEHLAELGFGTRLLFIGLWTLADREGRLEDRPKRIKMEVFPGDDMNVEKALTELHNAGFILRYQVAEARYIQVLAFGKHQNPHHREPPSTIPKPEARLGLECACNDPKPEALNVSDNHERPRQALGQTGTSPSPAVLIPDSGFLIPDSGSKTSCPEPSEKPARSRPPPRWNGATVCLMPVVAHTEPEIPITQEFVDEMQRAYPAVDVTATLPEIRAWCVANPSKRKTPSGVYRFVQSWLSREQNRG